MKTCIFCGSTDNLNTELNINVDGQKITVDICDEHAEDATIKTARGAYLDRQSKIEDLLKQAQMLGLNLSVDGSSDTPSKVIRETPSVKNNVVREDVKIKEAPPKVEELGDDFIPADMLDRPTQTKGGMVDGHNIESYGSYDYDDFQDKLPEDVRKGHAKLDMVQGDSGRPIAIPVERRDGTGSTKITIKKSSDDELQRNFANAAENEVSFRNGYNTSLKDCPLCRGTGEIKMNTGLQDCPKCGGVGMI